MREMKTSDAFKRFWHLAPDQQAAFKFCSVLMFLTLATELIRPFILERALGHIGAGRVEALFLTGWFFLGVLVLDYAFRGIYGYLFSVALLKAVNHVRELLFRHVLSMKMAFFDKRPVGQLLTRTVNDCEAMAETLRVGAGTIIIDMLTVVGIFGVMLHMDLHLTGVMMVTAPVIWLVVRWCGSRLRAKFIAVRSALAESNGFMAEGITGVEILQLFGRERESSSEFRRINKKYRRATITSNVYDALLYALFDGIAAVVTALLLYISCNIRFDALQLGGLIVYLNMVERIFTPLRDFSSKFATIQQAVAAMERILGLLDSRETIVQGRQEVLDEQLAIEFQKVGFRYQEDAPKVLEEISFRVEPGQSIALVGQTGSGKSTIGKLLIRAYDGYEGAILVGGVELRDLNYHCLRSNIAVVHQDVELFPGTLRDNITMYNAEIDDEAVMDAIKLVRAEHMVAALPGGLDFMVHESGNNLSTGQVQLIIFARALAHNAPIILMDEATSAVDSVTEAWIQQAIERIISCKTVVTVAHRLSTIAAADKIIVLKKGRIIEAGTHASLLESEQGAYAQLVAASRLDSALLA